MSDKGPIARTWAWITVGPWSAFALETAGFDVYAAIACGNLQMATGMATGVATKRMPTWMPAEMATSTTPIKASTIATASTRTTATLSPEKNKTFRNHVVAPKPQHHLAIAAVTSIVSLVYPFFKKEFVTNKR